MPRIKTGFFQVYSSHDCIAIKPAFTPGDENGQFISVDFYMEPPEARLIAAELIAAADRIDAPVAAEDAA